MSSTRKTLRGGGNGEFNDNASVMTGALPHLGRIDSRHLSSKMLQRKLQPLRNPFETALWSRQMLGHFHLVQRQLAHQHTGMALE
jgi:hypothetical protein